LTSVVKELLVQVATMSPAARARVLAANDATAVLALALGARMPNRRSRVPDSTPMYAMYGESERRTKEDVNELAEGGAAVDAILQRVSEGWMVADPSARLYAAPHWRFYPLRAAQPVTADKVPQVPLQVQVPQVPAQATVPPQVPLQVLVPAQATIPAQATVPVQPPVPAQAQAWWRRVFTCVQRWAGQNHTLLSVQEAKPDGRMKPEEPAKEEETAEEPEDEPEDVAGHALDRLGRGAACEALRGMA
jgi:hypothetical protein